MVNKSRSAVRFTEKEEVKVLMVQNLVNILTQIALQCLLNFLHLKCSTYSKVTCIYTMHMTKKFSFNSKVHFQSVRKLNSNKQKHLFLKTELHIARI